MNMKVGAVEWLTRWRGRPSSTRYVTFGIATRAVSDDARPRLPEWADRLGRAVGVPVRVIGAPSYEELGALVRRRAVDVAGLPPLSFVALECDKGTVPLVHCHRLGQAHFQSVLIVSAASRIQSLTSLAGRRAAWVDPLSSSGYVLPRIQLAAFGLDARNTFADERFVGSHDGVVDAVVSGRADVGATYATANPATDSIVGGSWSRRPSTAAEIRVLASFGAVPSDVVVCRLGLEPAAREKVRQGLLTMALEPDDRRLVKQIFGVDEFRKWKPSTYEALRTAYKLAAARGLFDGPVSKTG